MKPQIRAPSVSERDSFAKIAHEALNHGFDDFKKALEPKVGQSVRYQLWAPPHYEIRGPVKILEIKREGKRITHLKLADSPCWVKIEDILRG